jgi:hypothetical protein
MVAIPQPLVLPALYPFVSPHPAVSTFVIILTLSEVEGSEFLYFPFAVACSSQSTS